MSQNTSIEWTHHTANPWWGCTKLSPACDNCYAEVIARRLGEKLFGQAVGWGPGAERRYRVDETVSDARKWDRAAARAGERHRVFCSSMADVFEGLAEQRPYLERLCALIEETTHLDWLLLTKRPNQITRLAKWGTGEWPRNVWTGCTIENQEWADRRLPHLLAVPSVLRFVSVEPLFSALDLRSQLGHGPGQINWVICGGESGQRARGVPDVIDWYRDLRDQCVAAGVPFFFKQWGNFGQSHDGTWIKLRKKNPENSLDGVKWAQVPSSQPSPHSTLW